MRRAAAGPPSTGHQRAGHLPSALPGKARRQLPDLVEQARAAEWLPSASPG